MPHRVVTPTCPVLSSPIFLRNCSGLCAPPQRPHHRPSRPEPTNCARCLLFYLTSCRNHQISLILPPKCPFSLPLLLPLPWFWLPPILQSPPNCLSTSTLASFQSHSPPCKQSDISKMQILLPHFSAQNSSLTHHSPLAVIFQFLA